MTPHGPFDAPKDLSNCSNGDPVVAVLASQFESQASLHPDAPALTLDGESLTYGRLNARANQIAAYLRELGVGPESLVGNPSGSFL